MHLGSHPSLETQESISKPKIPSISHGTAVIGAPSDECSCQSYGCCIAGHGSPPAPRGKDKDESLTEREAYPPPLLSVQNLVVKAERHTLIHNASFDVRENEIVALVGESGSGKSMIAKCIMGLPPSQTIHVSEGTIFLKGQNLLLLDEHALRKLRGRQIAYIPQSPLNALNPIMTIGRQLIEAYHPFGADKQPSAAQRVLFLLRRVGFLQPELAMLSFPHQLSGGMRQRVLIAMALMNSPRFLIADEPTTALDVTLQAEILHLLQELKKEYGIGILLITHDLGIVARCANRVVILRHGTTIETNTVENIFYHPTCEYTKTLLDSLLCHPTLMASAV
jgi:ABC-type dipeptide/oligopeptide/nickel transport system ATPase component